ncbi:MAG: tRNA (guanosine(37)-N1)-methyltransferase TrmD [Suilimivivens sp.]
MNFHVLTLFPEMIEQGLHTSITGRSLENGTLTLHAVNIRDYTTNKHKKVDDYPYGGGAGMLMQAQPVYDAYKAVVEEIAERKAKTLSADSKFPRVIYLTPQGTVFNQSLARELAKEEDLIFLCGHYEGIDERVLEEIVTDNISIGDYVLTGGELPALVLMDAISRMVPGVLGNQESKDTESHSNYLLEYPQYSRPEIWHDKRVPEILLSGNHAKVDEWRLEQSLARTKETRPDLYEKWVSENEEYFIRKKKREERKKRNEWKKLKNTCIL